MLCDTDLGSITVCSGSAIDFFWVGLGWVGDDDDGSWWWRTSSSVPIMNYVWSLIE